MKVMARLESGKLHVLKRKLTLFIAERISLNNESKMDIEYEVEEVPDGTKPTFTIKIKRLLRRKKK
jgi:hypothetical protein